MIKVSELLGKPLICLSAAAKLGTVENLVFDPKLQSVKLLKIFSDSDTEPETSYVEFRRLKDLKFDACVVADKGAATFEWNTGSGGVLNPVNADCYNQNGKHLGRVRDILLDGASVKTIILDNGELDPALLVSCGGILIVNDTGKPVKLVKKKPSVPRGVSAAGQQTVTLHQKNKAKSASEAAVDSGAVPNKPDAVSLPSRVPPENTLVSRTPQKDAAGDPGAYNFLLGKKISRAIYGENGKMIIAENTVVSEETIRAARANGKLVQLALYAD